MLGRTDNTFAKLFILGCAGASQKPVFSDARSRGRGQLEEPNWTSLACGRLSKERLSLGSGSVARVPFFRLAMLKLTSSWRLPRGCKEFVPSEWRRSRSFQAPRPTKTAPNIASSVVFNGYGIHVVPSGARNFVHQHVFCNRLPAPPIEQQADAWLRSAGNSIILVPLGTQLIISPGIIALALSASIRRQSKAS